MREQVRLVFWLLVTMCAIRFGLAAWGYAAPEGLMEVLGAPADVNPQMPYIVRVWAVRDLALAVLILLSSAKSLKPLLYACIAIDLGDVISAVLSAVDGQYSPTEALELMSTAIAALVPECIALALILRGERKKGAAAG